MKVEFTGQSARDADNPAGNPSRLINGLREPMIAGGRSAAVLRAVPGMASFAELPEMFCRDMMEYDGAMFVAMGGDMYRVQVDGTVTLIGSIGAIDDNTGLAKSTGYVVAVGGGAYYHWDGTTLASVGTGAVTAPASVAYLGGYVLVSQNDGRVFAWSALADPTTWGGLDFASAEITDDAIIRLVVFKDALLVFKATGFERWAVTGLAGPDAFQRIGGAQEEPGLADYNLITTFPNGFAYVATDGRVYLSGAGPISTPPVEVAVGRLQPERMFYYEQRGHGLICLTFRNDPAWCYDTATGEWHERSQNEGPWLARSSVKVGGDWYIGTDRGQIAKLSTPCLDFGQPMVRRYVSRTLEIGQRFNVASVEAFPRILGDIQGAGDGTEAKVTLETSRDGGYTYSLPKDRGVGLVGEYETRLVWRALGQFRKATVALSQSSVVDVPLLSEVDVQVVQ